MLCMCVHVLFRTLAAWVCSIMDACIMLHGRPKLAVAASKTLKLGSMPGRPRNSVSYLTSGCAAAVCHNISLLYAKCTLLTLLSLYIALSPSLSCRSSWKWLGQVRPHLWRSESAQRSRHSCVGQRLGDHCEYLSSHCACVSLCVWMCQTPVCVLVFACGRIKIVLYRISFWRGRNLSVYLCAVDSFAGIAIDPTGGFLCQGWLLLK